MKPDLATLVGLVGAIGIVGFGIAQGKGGIMLFVNIPSLLVVMGGSVFVVMMKFGIGQILGAVKIALKAFFFKGDDNQALINRCVELAEKARRQGVVSLEGETITEPFLKDAIRKMIDNVDPVTLRTTMTIDISKTVERHDIGQKIFTAIGDVGPAMGMIGTLIGLVQMLANMSDPTTIGPAMAVALLTTLYGAMLANMFALPIADKLSIRSGEEKDAKLLLMDAVTGIQTGMHPKVLQEALLVYLPGSKRATADDVDG